MCVCVCIYICIYNKIRIIYNKKSDLAHFFPCNETAYNIGSFSIYAPNNTLISAIKSKSKAFKAYSLTVKKTKTLHTH